MSSDKSSPAPTGAASTELKAPAPRALVQRREVLAGFAASSTLAACGGGGGGDSAAAPPPAPAPTAIVENYGSSVNAQTAAFSYRSAARSRDQEVSLNHNYSGRVFLRETGGKAIMFDFGPGHFRIGLVSGLSESAYQAATEKLLHNQGAGLTPGTTLVFGVSGFDIYVKQNGAEILRFKSIHHAVSGSIATKEALNATRSAGTATFFPDAVLHSDIDQAIYDPRDFGLRSLSTTGSISAASTILSVADASGFRVGDHIIVEVGAESGAGARGTKGVGGTWPALSYPSATAREADVSQPNNTFAWQEDTGECWRWTSGTWTQPYRNAYYLAKAVPRALQARITGIAGNELTLSAPAKATAANANVYLDNTPFINQMTYHIWYKFGSPVGDLRSFLPARATIRLPAGAFHIGGKIYLGEFAAPFALVGQGDTTILQSPRGAPSAQINVVGHRDQTVVRNLKMVGNCRDNGFGFDWPGVQALPRGSGSGGMEWGYADAFISETGFTAAGAYPPGVLMTSCIRCVVDNVTSVDIFQKSIGASYCTDCFARNSRTIMTDGLRQYVQWCYQWADCLGGGIEDCAVTSPRLIAGAEVFRSNRSDITRFVGNNATMASNSSGNFVFADCRIAVTVTSNIEAVSAFSKQNPLININSNIQPASGAVAAGGSIVNAVMTQADYIDADKNSLRGIVINAHNPNITVSGGSYAAPDFRTGSALDGACGINSTGPKTTITGFTVIGKARHEVLGGSSMRNINCTGGGGSVVRDSTANEIYVNP